MGVVIVVSIVLVIIGDLSLHTSLPTKIINLTIAIKRRVHL